MNFFENILKYVLYIFNLVFLICGILLITLGSLMLSSLGKFKSFDQAMNTATIPIIIIVLGSIIFVISFFGCCGTIRENVFCTSVYAAFMFILFCLQISLVVWIFVNRQEFLNAMSNVVKTAWQQNDQNHGFPMDALQLNLKCCGLDSYNDYVSNNQAVPNSCCGKVSIANECPQSEYQRKPGCEQAFKDFWTTNMNIIRWGGIAVAAVEILAMTFACCVITGIRRRGHNF